MKTFFQADYFYDCLLIFVCIKKLPSNEPEERFMSYYRLEIKKALTKKTCKGCIVFAFIRLGHKKGQINPILQVQHFPIRIHV